MHTCVLSGKCFGCRSVGSRLLRLLLLWAILCAPAPIATSQDPPAETAKTDDLAAVKSLSAAGATFTRKRLKRSSVITAVTIEAKGELPEDVLKHLAGLPNCSGLTLRGAAITDNVISRLAGNETLERVNVASSKATGRSVKVLSGLAGLKRLALFSTPLDDEALASLRDTNLERLELGGTNVSDKSMPMLASLKRLRSLGLNSTLVTDEGLAHLKAAPCLESLQLLQTRTTLNGLRSLSEVKTLEHLRMSPETTDGMEFLSNLSHLKILVLEKLVATDALLMHIRPLSSLEYLAFHNADLTEAGIRSLGDLKHLKALDLPDVGVPGLEVARLKKRLPNAQIRFGTELVE